ncbi:transcription factor E2F6 isoform X1 [Rhizophagus clarus]|uniref:Transcription factor E2F6 isoform X1 n=1 Tax=Rhizophagus clarus TaxID=94130 RepID=A0A8H3LDL9_9GLOM|nr:transcription factor E2F6 isoform X1 [Rhizophagus clarus]
MPPTSTVTAASRVREFPEDFFVDNGKLICCFCDHSINFQTKNTITAHIGSKTHLRNKKEKKEQQIKKRQPTIQTILNASEIKKTVINNLVDAFVTTDIPLEKIDKLQNWLRENCNEGGFIPISVALHRDYLPKLFEDHLVHVDYLENVNNCTIGQLIIQILVQWGISFDLPQLVASDLAAYMKKCYRDVLKLLMPQLIHLPCLAYILNLIGQKVCYKSYLQRQGVSNPKNIPLSNTTRWNTWFRMAFHVYQNLDYICGFYNEESKENSTPMIEKINSAFTDQQINGQNKPIFPFIEQRLQQLEAQITMEKTITNVGSTMDLVLQKFNSPLMAFCPVFQQAYYAAYKKLEDHVLQHPACSLFRAVQVFDPRFLTLTTANRDIYSYQIIRELANPSTSLIQEWSIYVNINLNLIEFSELNEFWDKVSLQLPLLEKIA